MIPHRDFLNASEIGRVELLVSALKRSVNLMAEFRVSSEDQAKLLAALDDTYRQLAASKNW